MKNFVKHLMQEAVAQGREVASTIVSQVLHSSCLSNALIPFRFFIGLLLYMSCPKILHELAKMQSKMRKPDITR